MKRIHILSGFCIIIILVSSFCFARDEIGVITYIKGEVSITRDEEELDSADIDVDTPLENYDMIKTGEDGIAEIDITTESGQNISITVSEDTAFSIEIDQLEGKESTAFEMFTGGLSLKVNTLIAHESVEVVTESSSMGVRGTQFSIESEVTGDVLITCEEGIVACIDEDGEEQLATPEFIVEKAPGVKMLRNQVKKGELAAYRKEWRKKKIEGFKKDGLPAFRRYAKRFNRLHEVLLGLAGELKKHQEILERWRKFARNNKKPPKKVLEEDIKKIQPILVEMKKVANIFERVVFQLLRMEPYHKQGHLKGDMGKGVKVEKFYAEMKKKVKEIKRIFGRLRRLIKLFMKMNNGHFPRNKARIKFDNDFENYNPQF